MKATIAALFFGLMTWVLSFDPSKSNAAYLNPPPEYVEHFAFGFSESAADSFWLRWIQDSTTCQTYLAPALKTPELSEGPLQDLTSVPRHKVCDQSWGFKMLDAVTKLAPKFKMPYLAGASALAILVEDFEGSSVIYERGISEYPEDWQLLYRASFHYQFNIKDRVKASQLLDRAADLGGPNWLKSLASRLLTEAGELELGLRTLESYKESLRDSGNEEAIEKVNKRIEELRARIRN